MATLFISDLHLSADRPTINTLFVEFLETQGTAAEALYILGDLFEYWIGDEAIEAKEHAPIIQALRNVKENGTPLFVMRGNRDFLIGPDFAASTGCTILNEPCVIDLYGVPTLLMHGDLLCTDDTDYQKFRSMVRDPQWQAQFLSKSVDERLSISEQLRETSKAAIASKTQEIMDVNQDAVIQAMKNNNVLQLIHGHTHRPHVHSLEVDGRQGWRYVLGDWYQQGSVLSCTARSCELATLPADSG